MAAELKMPVEEFQDALVQISNSTIAALDELWSVSDSSGDAVSLLDTLTDESTPDPAAVVDQTDLKDRVDDALARLPEREKLVVALYYYENLTLQEIGAVLGVTESRVSELHTKAVLRLRGRLEGEPPRGPDEKPQRQPAPDQRDRPAVPPVLEDEPVLVSIRRAARATEGAGAGPEQFVAAAQELRNTEARAKFVRHYDQLSEDRINDHARGRVADTEMAAQRWLVAGDIFGVGPRDSRMYPAFQFSRGIPKPVVQCVVEEFRSHGASDWEIALWFSTPNPWLRATPSDVLDENPSQVTGAAARVFQTPV
jgi:hypothetical protein